MKINQIHEVVFNTPHNILSATLSGTDGLVLLLSSGEVMRYTIIDGKARRLFSVTNEVTYMDGGFDVDSPSTLYTLNDIVVVANDYKTHALVHYPGKYRALRLWRQDSYARISCYPIALLKLEDEVPHIIYGAAWNHVQIMNLDTRQIITAAKSLIEEHAEERHIQFYKNHSEDNKLAWPTPYNYFYGKLQVSPNNKRFLSAGWAWGSYDSYRVYDIKRFIADHRISEIRIGGWEHENRAVCWVDDETVAVTYNPLIEGDKGATVESPCEIRLYKLNNGTVKIKKKIKVAGLNILTCKMYYNPVLKHFILFSEKIGWAVLDLKGNIKFHDSGLNPHGYSVETGRFLMIDDKVIAIYEIEK